MGNQYNENGGLRLKNEYSQTGSDYNQSFDREMGFGETNSSNIYQSESSYNNPGRVDDSYFRESYQSTYAGSTQHSVTSIMTGSFMYMFIALLVTGITAVITASSPTILSVLFGSSTSLMVVFVAEFAIVMGANAAVRHNSVVLCGVLFFVYSIVNGLTCSIIFIAYTASSIEQAFFAAAAVFGVMAFVGKITDRDLTSIGSLCFIGLIGVIITSLINIIIGSTALDMAVSAVTIVLFLGLTAYDTQKIKKLAESNTGYNAAVISLWGALELYLDFINIFLNIIRLMGKRK